jgi:hypothetical protein
MITITVLTILHSLIIALAAMLTGSMALMASNPIKTARTETPVQREVVSREGSEALRAVTFPGVQQTPAVPTVHNRALDEKLLKFCDNDEERNTIQEFLSSTYNDYGSYLGSAIVQQYLDINMFMSFLNGNIEILKRFDQRAYDEIDVEVMQEVIEKSEPIKQWLNENYFAAYNEPLGQFDHPPEAEEVSQALDNYVNADPYNLFYKKGGFFGDYTNANTRFKNTQKRSNDSDLQKNSDYVAFQVSRADYLLFKNLLIQAGIDIEPKYKVTDGQYRIISVDNNLCQFLGVCAPKPW